MKQWAKKLWLLTQIKATRYLSTAYALAIVAAIMDLASTYIALSVWPQVFMESQSFSAAIILLKGLEMGILLLLLIRVGITTLIYYSRLPIVTNFILLLLTAGVGFGAALHNTCVMISYVTR